MGLEKDFILDCTYYVRPYGNRYLSRHAEKRR
jgi:hypothetical protein